MAKTVHDILEQIDGYLISIKRNIDTSMYELEVGFRKNWVFKSTEDIECDIKVESDNGTLLTISGKHDEVTIDDLIEFVNKVIETNRKITEMQEKFEREMEAEKEKLAEKVMEFEASLDEVKETSFDDKEEKPKQNKKTTKKKTDDSEVSIEDDEKLAQKIS